MTSTVPHLPSSPGPRWSRRALIATSSAAVGAGIGLPWATSWLSPRASVFVARGQRYDGDLVQTIHDGLLAADFDPATVHGRRVLLKPNLVEPTRQIPHMTTHPAVILAAAAVFRGWGASVTVGEGPGHVRDTEMALVESGVGESLRDAGLTFADLNYEEVAWAPNRGRASDLKGFYFPRSVVEADLVVSLPKLKTHHWVGVTAAMKNLYGVIPGIRYGWPKNVLHHNGIPETVFDIHASLPRLAAIVDGIDCMEGDGPILGTRKEMGLLVMGLNLPAVDATVARLMQLSPHRVSYLRLAERRWSPVAEPLIEQRGEAWLPLAQPFQVLDQPHLRILCTGVRPV